MNVPASTESSQDTAGGTASRVLDAAENLFAEKGFAATSIREITVAAGCNVASVNYHYGSKEALYVATFQRRLTELRDLRIGSIQRALAASTSAATLESVIRAFAEAFLEPFLDETRGSRYLRMWSWELIDPHLPDGAFMDEMMGPVRTAFVKALGVTCPEIGAADALRCVTSVIGQLVHAVQLRRFEGPARSEKDERAIHGQLIDHVVRFSAAGVRAFPS